MTRVCAWCDRVLGEVPGPLGITHGLCDACYPRVLAGVKAFGADETNETDSAAAASAAAAKRRELGFLTNEQ